MSPWRRQLHNALEDFEIPGEAVGLGGSGTSDKTILEATAYDGLSVASSKDYARFVDQRPPFNESDSADLAAKLEFLLAIPDAEKETIRKSLRSALIERYGLRALISCLKEKMYG